MEQPCKKSHRIGVVGASGRLGSIVAQEVRLAGFEVEPISRSGSSIEPLGGNANEAIKLDANSRSCKFTGLSAIIIAAPQTSSVLHRYALEAGCNVIDVGIAEATIRDALTLHPLAKERGLNLILMAGLAPGLTGLLGRSMSLRHKTAQSVDVVLLQHKDGVAGRQGTRDMLDMLTDPIHSETVTIPGAETPFSNGMTQLAFRLPTAERNLLLGKAEDPVVSYFTLFNSTPANQAIRVLRTIRSMSDGAYCVVRNAVASMKALKSAKNHETINLFAIATSASGKVLGREELQFASDYGATAKIAVSLADMALSKELTAGAGHPARFTTLQSVTRRAFPTLANPGGSIKHA